MWTKAVFAYYLDLAAHNAFIIARYATPGLDYQVRESGRRLMLKELSLALVEKSMKVRLITIGCPRRIRLIIGGFGVTENQDTLYQNAFPGHGARPHPVAPPIIAPFQGRPPQLPAAAPVAAAPAAGPPAQRPRLSRQYCHICINNVRTRKTCDHCHIPCCSTHHKTICTQCFSSL